MKIKPPVYLAVGYVAAQSALFIASFSEDNYSYGMWAGIMMLLGGLLGISALFMGLMASDRAVLASAAILLGGCGLPIVLLLTGAAVLGF
jgi:hypothetical protein